MTMTLQENIRYWVESAQADWAASQSLIQGGHLLHGMFFIRLVLEKLLKANWILDNGEAFPPMTHNLELLYSQTELELSPDQVDVLKLVTTWNLEGRYQDYRNKIARSYSWDYIRQKLIPIETIKQCLHERLP